MNVLKDVVDHKPFDQSLRFRLGEAKQSLKRKANKKIDSLLKGSGYKKRKTLKRTHSSIVSPTGQSLKTKSKKKRKKSTHCASKLIDIFR